MAFVATGLGWGTESFHGARNFSARAGYGPGDEAGWAWSDNVLSVHTDRLGIVPLYVFQDDKRFICTDNLSGMFALGVPCSLDPVMVILNRILSYCPNELTIFRGIRRLPPSSQSTCSADLTVSVSGEWNIPPAVQHSRYEAADKYAAVFEEAVGHLTAEGQEYSVPLSGGRDSRHILLAMNAAGRRIKTMTFASLSPPDTDMPIAIELSRRIGTCHTVVPNSLQQFHESMVNTLPTIHFESIQHGWIWGLAQVLRAKGLPFVDGLGGDTLSNALFFSQEQNRMLKDGQVPVLARRQRDHILAMKGPHSKLVRANADRIESILRSELGRWQTWPNPHMAYVFFNRTRRAIASAPMALAGLASVPVVLPYLHQSVFDLLMGLDDRFHAGKGFHDLAISRKYPAFDDVPYAERAVSARTQYLKGVRSALPYADLRILRKQGDDNFVRRLTGIAKVLCGYDFEQEYWRFVSYDLACSVERMLAAVRSAGPAGADCA